MVKTLLWVAKSLGQDDRRIGLGNAPEDGEAEEATTVTESKPPAPAAKKKIEAE